MNRLAVRNTAGSAIEAAAGKALVEIQDHFASSLIDLLTELSGRLAA